VDVFLGGEREGKRSSRVCVAEKFSQDERAPNVYVVICYMSIICYMHDICLVQSPPQEAVLVFGYIEGPFLERHAT
jgi:hypothetical protein